MFNGIKLNLRLISSRSFSSFVTNVKPIFSMALHFHIDNPDVDNSAVELLKLGHVIAVPTDTVYGFACCATNTQAIDLLFKIKTRNEDKPVAICVGRVADVNKWAQVEHLPKGLLSALLPGPVTLVLNCINKLDSSLTSSGKVGIRIPDYPFIRNIANSLDCPLALTSANLSGQPSSVDVSEFKSLWNQISGIFDGGNLGSKRDASTVIDLSEANHYKIIRTGVAADATISVLQKFYLKPVSY